MTESRELRNKRIALELLDMLEQIAAAQPRGTLPGINVAGQLDGFKKRWEARGVPWLRPDPHYDPDEWLTAVEMSTRADVEPATVRRWHLRGHITASPICGRLHYNTGEVVAYLAKRDHARRLS